MKNLTRRQLWPSLGLGALSLALPTWAQQPAAARKPQAAAPWRFLINEAVTGETNLFLLTSRYRPLAEYLGQQLKGRTIDVEPIVDIQRFMAVAKGTQKPELVFGKSVNQLAKLVRDQGYQPLVRRADPYKAAFIVDKGSSFKTLADIGSARIIMPDEFAATTAVARAELFRLNVNKAQVLHVKYQEAVAQQVKSGLGQVGVVNPTTAKKWVEEGGRVLAETQPVVNWSVLAAPGLPAETVAQLRQVLLAMNTQATSVLAGIGVKEWAAAEPKDYLALLAYTKE
jgi:ABC-type phosphate/phosphonate transport system substrate-binding protein